MRTATRYGLFITAAMLCLPAAALAQATGQPTSPTPAEKSAPTARPAPLTLADEVRALKTMDSSGDPKASLAHIEDVLARAKGAKAIDPVDLLYGEAARAAALFWLQRYDETLAIFHKVDAELTARKVPINSDRAELLDNIGAVLGTMGKLDEGFAYKLRALDLNEKLTGRESIEYASALYGVALIEYRRGKPLEAFPKVKEALRIARAAAERTGENLEKPAIYGLSLSALQIQAGDSASAVDMAREAALWADTRLGENHRVTMAALNQLGSALNDAGLYAQAIPVLRRTLDLRIKAYPAGHPDIAFSLQALGFALDNSGHKEEAQPFYERASEIFEHNSDPGQPTTASVSFGQLARLAKWRGDAAESLRLREKSLKLGRDRAHSPEHPDVLLAEINMAGELMSAGRMAEARPLLAHANAAFAVRALPNNLHRMGGLVYAAQLEAASGQPALGFTQSEAALAPARTRLLDRATPRSELARLAEQYHPLFVEHARLALASGHVETGFEALQLANLGDLQTASSALAGLKGAPSGEAAEAVRRYQELAAEATRLRRASNQSAAGADAAKTEVLNSQLTAVEGHLREQDQRLTALIPGYAVLTAVEPASLAAARAALGPRQALLIYGQDEGGLVAFALTPNGSATANVAVSSRRLLDLQRRLRGSIDEGLESGGTTAFDRKTAYELYQILFPAPIRKLLRQARDLEVRAPGSLASLPFAALVTAPPQGADDAPEALRQTRWLAGQLAVSAQLSSSPLPVRAEAPRATVSFAGIGAPVLGASSSRLATRAAGKLRSGDTSVTALRELASLPDAARELTSMADYFNGQRQLLIGAEATETAVKHMPLEQADVVAFATHGLVGGAFRDLIEPALVLTPPAVPTAEDDGLLTATEIAKLRLNADWVILSACDTSAGESENAPTFSGLARSFVSAGARSLLLSHWPVRDDVASRLTLNTVDGARHGLSRAQALRAAQVAILHDRSVPGGAHPATWAPFVLVGR